MWRIFFSMMLIAAANISAAQQSTLIQQVLIADGSGKPMYKGSVRIAGNRIVAVGSLQALPGENIVQGNGKILAPGFIDTHSHLYGYLDEAPEALAALNQGITTIITGQDGDSDWIDSIKAQLNKRPVAVNVATYTGQTSLREIAMGANDIYRSSTAKELSQMQQKLQQELQQGSLGLSTGLEYEGSFYSHPDEVVALAKTTAQYGGRYMSHIRSEDIHMDAAIDEILNIGQQANIPVQISHIKIALKDKWGTAPALLRKLDSARKAGIMVTADCYPYDFWNSTIRVLFPNKDFTSLTAATYATEQLFDPAGSVMVRFAPNKNYVGKTVAEIAQLRNETAAQTLLYMVAAADSFRKANPDAGGVETIMGKSMYEKDIADFMQWPHTNMCSDGGNGGHPRGYGSFTRILHQYVTVQKVLSWEMAIHKMTALAAQQTGIQQRGRIAVGYFADLVLIDPTTVKDNASIANPKALSNGIQSVWVNGVLTYQQQQHTGKFPGTFVSRL